MSSTTGTGALGVHGAPPAPLGRRVAAWLVDGILTSVAAAPLWLAQLPVLTASLRDAAATEPGGLGAAVAPEPVAADPLLLAAGAVLLLAWAGFQWWCQGTRGWTVGRRLLGLRTVDVRTGRPIGLGRALGRYLIVVLGSLACGIGQAVVLLSPLFDGTGRRRGWHDRVGEAIVVDVRGLAATRRVAAWDGSGPATGPVPAAPAPAPVVSVDPTPSEPTRTRWTTLATERQLDGPGLVLPPLGAPGPGPDLDTRQMPVVPPAAAPAHPAAPTVVAPGWPAMAPAPQPAPPEAPAFEAPVPPVPAQPVPAAPAPAPPAPPAPAPPAPAPEPGAWGRHAARPSTPVHPDSASVQAAPVAPAPAPAVPAPAAPAPAWLDREVSPPPAPGPATGLPALPPEAFPSPDASPAAGAGWAVRLPDGTIAGLDAPLLVGRNPDPQPGVRTVPVADPSRSVSKNHLMLGVDDQGPWIVDRGSTNGTLVTLADGQRIVCLPDRRVRLSDGSLVTFGDLSLSVGVRA
jgi:hypothetical protein